MPTRRALLAAAAIPLTLTACGGEGEDEREQERDAADLEIVRFLLGIEDVESRFWSDAQERGSLASVGVPDQIVSDVARNEREHVTILEGAARRRGCCIVSRAAGGHGGDCGGPGGPTPARRSSPRSRGRRGGP